MRLRLIAALIGLAVAAAACGSADETATTEVQAGDAATFCARWPETKFALQEDFDREGEWDIQSAVDVVRRTLDEADALVPGSLRPSWEVATRFSRTAVTLIDIAEYQPDRLRQELIDAAFGEGGVEAAAAASAEAIEDLDAWATNECLDFCTMWPRLERALDFDPYDDQAILFEGEADEALLLQGDALVPDAVRADWEGAASMKLRLIDLYRSWNWEPRWHDEVPGLGEQVFQQESVLEPYFEDREDAFGERGLRELAALYSTERREAVGAWVEANCEAVGTSGLPGTVQVEGGPLGTRGNVLMAALPRGFDPAEVEDAADFLGVACIELHPGQESWTEPLLTRERDFSDPCTALDMGHQGASRVVLPAGEYELFVGRFPAGVGRFGLYVPAPEECALERFTVDGETTVTLPELGPCSLGPFDGSPEEIARRQPPSEPVGPSGTLEVVLTDYPRHDRGGVAWITVLPGGTTLDQIWLGDAWPSGFGCMHFPPWEEMDPQQQGRIASQGVPIPILQTPVTGQGTGCTGPWEIWEGMAGDPVEVAAGGYDVYVLRELEPEGEGEQEADIRCGRTTVSVSGPTRAEMPSLEEECRW